MIMVVVVVVAAAATMAVASAAAVAVMVMQWNLRINGILYQWLLYPETGYVCPFMFAARLAVSCCFRQFNAKHSVLVFSEILDTTKRLRQAMEYGIFIL